MKYLISVITCALLAGCWSTTRPTDIQTLTKEARSVDSYADKNDLVMSRAAASVLVAKEANLQGNAKTVENELSVALNYLPKPSNEDLEYAKKRAKDADPKSYEKAKAVADAHQRQLDDLWSKVEAEKQRAKDAIELKEKELVAERKKFSTMVITLVGGLGVAAGLAMLLFGFNKINAFVSVFVGTLLISSVWLFELPWFGWISGGSFLAVVIEAWRRYRGTVSQQTTVSSDQPK